MQKHSGSLLMPIRVHGIEPAGIEAARATLDAMYFVAFIEQQFRQVRAVLASNARN